jgi:tetratricopeptide (TPR) repeat protein
MNRTAVIRRVCVTALIPGLLTFSASAVLAQAARPGSDPGLTPVSRALAAGDTDRALSLAKSYVQRQPDDVAGQVLLVRVYVERNEIDAAYRAAAVAVRKHPADTNLLYYLGLATRGLAAREFERLATIAPDSARVHQLQAEMFDAQERRADAEKEYAAALTAKPDLLEPLLGLAKLQRIRLACEEARALYERAEAVRPTFDAAYGLGVCLGYLQNDQLAAKYFEQAVQRNPSAAVAWAGFGTSLVKLGRTADGIAKLQRAIALAPEMDEAHYMLGMAYQASGDPVRAQESFKKAEQLRNLR